MRPLCALFAALAVSFVPACGEPCANLSEALCDGGDAAYCKQVDDWLAGRLIDPQTKEPLVGQPRTQMCTTIYGSVDIFNAYRFKAKQVLLGEPDFTLASSTPAANKADPTPVPIAPAKAAPATPPTPTPAVDDEKAADKDEDKPPANMSD
jgi:hypothetical protein